MNPIFRTLGLLLSCLSLSMLPPIGVADWYQDSSPYPFVIAFVLTLAIGLTLWQPWNKRPIDLKTRDGFVVVFLFWSTLCLFASVPLYLSISPHIPITDAIFETVSGLTTTGATIFRHIDALPHAVLYYRQQLQLLGGIGIVVLAVAVLPMLGIGGMQLYRAEIAGPLKNNKLTPRITQTAKALWLIYTGMTILCIISYVLAGMPLFDAIGEGFSTVATGGFSVHDASLAYYNSRAIQSIAMVFMVLSALNFSLHFQFLKHKSAWHYWRDQESRTFIKHTLIGFLIVVLVLIWKTKEPLLEATWDAAFTTISMATTTGLSVTEFGHWPNLLPCFVLLLALIGGCAGSTSGGIKVIRAILLREQAKQELHRMIHPRSVTVLKYGNKPISSEVIQAIWGFVVLFVLVYCVLLLLLLATGLPLQTAFAALTACLSNVGASIGAIANHYHDINSVAKWLLILTMLIGRLEIFTLIVLLMPSYWHR